MARLGWLRWSGEALKVLVPAGATACFLFFDLYGIQQEAAEATLDWQYWALVCFAVFCAMVLIDFGRLLSRVRQLESTRADLRVTTHEEHIADSDWYRIIVHNASEVAQAKDVIVKLQSIEPSP